MEGLPAVLIGDDTVGPAERFEQYRRLGAEVVDITPAVDEHSFRGSSVQYLVDGLIAGRSPHDAVAYRRDASHLRDGATDAVCVQVFLTGRMRGVVGTNRGIDLHPGNVGVQDFAHPFAATTTHSDSLFVYVPRSRVDTADQLHRRNPSISFARSSERGGTLSRAVIGLCRAITTAQADQAAALASRFVDTLNRVLDPQTSVRNDVDLRRRLDVHLWDNLSQPWVNDVATLCTVAGVSRATLYRLYQPDGGVQRYIRRTRLRRCLFDLSRPDGSWGTVGEIATRWGYDNPGHFTRLFKQEFGVPPSAVVRRRRREGRGVAVESNREKFETARRWQRVT